METLQKITQRIDVGDCWTWTGAKARGYGQVSVDGKVRPVHRALWEILVGLIPKGRQLDHLCYNRACCNPDHLRVVTPGENIRSSPKWRAAQRRLKEICVREHIMAENIYIRPSDGKRRCLACIRERSASA